MAMECHITVDRRHRKGARPVSYPTRASGVGVLGLISYLSSTVFFSPAVTLFLLPIAGFRLLNRRYSQRFRALKASEGAGLYLLLYAAVLTIPVFILGKPVVPYVGTSLFGPIPYLTMVVAAVLVGIAFDRRDLVVILGLVYVEIAVGLAEFVLGVNTFFAGADRVRWETDLLYFKRVFGMSTNSSVYAFKVLVAFMIVMVLRSEWSRKMWFGALGILSIGFVTSFGRTALMAAALGWLAYYAARNRKMLLIWIATVITVGFVYSAVIFENLTLGRSGEEFVGERHEVYAGFLAIITERPLFGNATRKVWLDIGGGLHHAHNSYLELIASNGIVISGVFLMGFYLLLLRGRVIYALPLLVYSLLQYGLFWGLSFHDVSFSGLMVYLMQRERQRAWTSDRLPDDSVRARP
jgi:hypothetical protein